MFNKNKITEKAIMGLKRKKSGQDIKKKPNRTSDKQVSSLINYLLRTTNVNYL